MSWFGLTEAQLLHAWSMDKNMFTEPVGGAVDNGSLIISEALTRAEATVKSQLPDKTLRMLSRIEGEVVVQDADSGQTTASLAISATTTSQIVLWKFSQGTFYSNELYKASTYRLKAFSVGADKKTLTFTTALEVGDIIIASYPVGLINNCPSLQGLLLDIAAKELLVPRYPARAAEFGARYESALTYFAAMRSGNAMLPELMVLRMVEDLLPDRGKVTVATWRLPQ